MSPDVTPTPMPTGRPPRTDGTPARTESPRVQVRVPFSIWLHYYAEVWDQQTDLSSILRTLIHDWTTAHQGTNRPSRARLHPAACRMDRGRPWHRPEDPDVPHLPSKPLATRLEPAELERLDACLDGTDVSRSMIVRHLLYTWLEIPQDWQDTPEHTPHWSRIDPNAPARLGYQ